MSNYPCGYNELPSEEDYYKTAINKLEAENAALIAKRDALLLDKMKLIEQREKAYKINRELQARIDGGIRLHAYYKNQPGGFGHTVKVVYAVSTNMFPENSTLVIDEGVTL